MNRLCLGRATHNLAVVSRSTRQLISCGRTWMSNRNYFNALAGLKLEDSPAGSPTAAAAAARMQGTKAASTSTSAAALSSSDKAEALKAGGSSTQQEAAAAAGSNGSDGAEGPTEEDASRRSSSSSDKAKSKSKKVKDALVWIDLEMTGLDLNKHTIIEIACLVTDADLTRVWEGPEIVINHPESVLAGMNEWCQEHHNKSGLAQRVRDSTVSLQEAEQQVLEFVRQHTEYQQAQLAGNSVHIDRAFLQRYMPELAEHFHHRIIDVSTIKELCRRWRVKLYRQAPRKVAAHTAMSDIKESLKELQYYKHVLFRGK